MARSDHTIYRFEIACLAKFADCTQLAVGGKFQIEKMLKDDPDLYPSMEDDYNLGSVRVTGSEQSAVYFVINQESAAARSDEPKKLETMKRSRAMLRPLLRPDTLTRKTEHRTRADLHDGQAPPITRPTEYSECFPRPGNGEWRAKQHTFFVICLEEVLRLPPVDRR